MFEQLPILSIIIWLPIIAAVLVLFTGGDKNANYARGIAVVAAVANILLCIPLYLAFDSSTYNMQFMEDVLWIRAYQTHYALGIDGISLIMVILTNFTGLLVEVASSVLIHRLRILAA